MAELQGMTPDTPHTAVSELTGIWATCRDVFAGTRAIHTNYKIYLSQHPKERAEDFERRATVAEFFNAYARTIRAMAGQVFSREPKLGDDVGAVIQEHCESIDGESSSLTVFARNLFEDALCTGTAGILVDMPQTSGTLSIADEEAFGVRPYWVMIKAEQVVTWRFGRVGAKQLLTLLVLKEDLEAPVGDFGAEVRVRYRVFRRALVIKEGEPAVSFEVWEQVTKNGKTEVVPTGERGPILGVTEIPYAPLAIGHRTSKLTSSPPLLDLLDANLGHFRVTTERRWLMHLCCVPVPVRIGYVPPMNIPGVVTPTQAFGANILQDLPIGGSFGWVEPTGTAFTPTQEEKASIERHMAALGLAFLASESRAAETAEAKKIDAAAQNASLASCADALDDCIEMALGFHAQFLKLESGGSFSTNRDYEKTVLDSATIQTYSGLAEKKQLTLETLWALLERGGALPDDFDPEKERTNLELYSDEPMLDPMTESMPLMDPDLESDPMLLGLQEPKIRPDSA